MGVALHVRLADGSEDVFEPSLTDTWPDGYETCPPISRERVDFAFQVDGESLVVLARTTYRKNEGWPERETWAEPDYGDRAVGYYRPEQWTSVREH